MGRSLNEVLEGMTGMRPRAGDAAPPPVFTKRIPLVATSVSIPRTLYKAIDEVRIRTGETRSAVIIRYCLDAAINDLANIVGKDRKVITV